jgi:hypothetical protein
MPVTATGVDQADTTPIPVGGVGPADASRVPPGGADGGDTTSVNLGATRAADPDDVEETQVIRVQPPAPHPVTDTAIDLDLVDSDDRPHLIPGFDRDDDTPDRTQVLPPSGTDDTQVIPASDDEPPGDAGPSRRRGGRPGGPNRPGGRKRR